MEWRKSSFSASSNECIELRVEAGAVELRESEEGEVTLRISPAAIADLLRTIKAGDLDRHA
ncbi:DUF397 domain-containing protein [Kitasatospora sp. NPDC094019]|uniref:DUF397 domain-containing protein n=1 Tax=Kitasatospora sp. NPDC094019 TaxID=3364091 RepID=UPI00380B4476